MSMPPYDPYKPPMASLDAPMAHDPSAAVPGSVVEILGKTRPWVKFLSILFFVGMGLAVLTAVLMVTVLRSGLGRSESMILLPMLLVLIVYIPPAVFLWQYAAGIRSLQNGGGLP